MAKTLNPQLVKTLNRYESKVLRETSTLGLRPGDIIQFSYISAGSNSPSTPYGIVVSSQRTSTGLFLSTKGNSLINVILIADTLSEAMTDLMINNIYKNRTACSYKNLIGTFLGKENFRTYNSGRMTDLLSVEITK